MNRYSTITFGAIALLYVGAAPLAQAQSFKEKITGTWTLEAGLENFPDGKKLTPWSTGNLILTPTGHMSFFVIGKDQPKTSPSVRIPVGPVVAYYGTYTVDEANATITYKIDHAASPTFNGADRIQKITFKGDVMVTTGSDVETPEGKMSPVNEWKRAK
jgi:hypothetical protein